MKRNHIIIFFVVVICALPTSSFAQYEIKGRCIDELNNDLPSVLVKLYDETGGKLISNVLSKQNGEFVFNNIESKRYSLRLSFVGYMNIDTLLLVDKNIDIGVIQLNPDSKILDEIVVTVQDLESFGNRDEIRLSSDAVKVGNNALDAISSLPQFKKNALDDQLKTVDNRSILILIDGRRSNNRELQQLSAENIKKLTYYSEPPARFAQENFGAVLEIQTKRQKSESHFLYLDTKNSFTTGYGTNMINYTYTNEKNQLTLAYFHDYRSLNDNRMNNYYKYSNKSINEYKGNPGSYRGIYHIAQVRYSRYFVNDAFLTSQVQYNGNPGHEKYSQEVIKINNGSTTLGKSERDLRSNYNSWSLDLYYHQPLGENKVLGVNLVNYLTNSSSDNVLNRTMDSNLDDYNYVYRNLTKNNSVSSTAEILYRNNAWNFGVRNSYNYLIQTIGTESDTNQKITKNTLYGYADYSGRMNKLSYNVGVGVEYSLYKSRNNQPSHYVVPRPSFTLNYKLSPGSSIRFVSVIQSTLPSLGYLADSRIAIDEKYFFKGNPTLRPYYMSVNKLNLQWSSKDNNYYFSSSLNYNYSVKPFAPVLRFEDNQVVKTYGTLNNSKSYGLTLSGSAKLFKYFTLQPFYQLIRYKYSTPNQRINHTVHNGGIGIQASYNEFQFNNYLNFPFTDVSGDFYKSVGINNFASLMWKHKAISLSLECLYSLKPNRTYVNLPNFQMEESLIWNNFRGLLNLKFTYYFQKGKSKKQTNALLSNTSSDTGLIRENTAK
ncbi:outer membrane beta-barrel protein [Porphyromonadaceae bacterium W3.11]|nr:outer membrane beta-barrel protein [Porphyromonadaceae bacterium W3.11]